METDKKMSWVFWFPIIFVGYFFIRMEMEGGRNKKPFLTDAYERKDDIYQDFLPIVKIFGGKKSDIYDSSNPPTRISFRVIFDKSITTNHDFLMNHGWTYVGGHIDGFEEVFCKNDVTLGFTSDSGIFLSYSKTDFCYNKVIVNGKLYEKVEQE